MLKKFLLIGMLSTGFLAAPLQAQQGTATSNTEMPAVQEADQEQGQSGLMSGEKPFTLMVDENVGELIYTFDEETKELESINAKNGVIFASEDMTLNSDQMEYKTINSSLVATGKRVVVRMGEMVVTCQVFKYNPETQQGDFLGNPIVYQRDKEGKVTTTAGRTINVVNVNGKFQMRVGAGGGTSTFVKSSGVAKNNGSGTQERTTLAPGQKPASITLNNTPSGLAVSGTAAGGQTGGDRANTGGGLVPVPNLDSAEEAPAAETAPATANKVDPDNPSDVKKLTEEKSQ